MEISLEVPQNSNKHTNLTSGGHKWGPNYTNPEHAPEGLS